jgi:hypothetical protein
MNKESGIRKTKSSIPMMRISELGCNLEIFVINESSID